MFDLIVRVHKYKVNLLIYFFFICLLILLISFIYYFWFQIKKKIHSIRVKYIVTEDQTMRWILLAVFCGTLRSKEVSMFTYFLVQISSFSMDYWV